MKAFPAHITDALVGIDLDVVAWRSQIV